MKIRVILPLLCCLLVLSLGVGMAHTSPELEISGSNITIDGGVTDAMLAEIKKENIADGHFRWKISTMLPIWKNCAAHFRI